MAIYVNDRILKADKNGSALEREYAQGLEQVNKLFEKFRIKGSANAYIQIARRTTERIESMTSKRQKKLPPIALPVEIPVYDDEMGAITLRYSVSPPLLNSNGNLNWGTKYIELRETLALTDKQKDLAWFLIIRSPLVKSGVYQLVDNEKKYQGEFNEILLQKNVMDVLTGKNEDIIRHLGATLISESILSLGVMEIAVRVKDYAEVNKRWTEVWNEIKQYNSSNVMQKEHLSVVEYDGDQVILEKCPDDMKYATLKAEATSLGIPLTVPPQSKDVLYSLINHVKNVNV